MAAQVENRLWGIVNSIRTRVSSARAEGRNSQIRAMRAKARGYRNKSRLKAEPLFLYGNLDVRI
ncbi:transposase [Burkholderia ubonensis]|uniref:transposase n=1 Tax=Burkholderia ubonensis TaxID=101571 RepID=UPI0039F4C3DE